MITAPGLFTDPAIRAQYHDDPCPEPSLSRSIAKLIAERTAGHAFHAHPRLNPKREEDTDERFDLGTAAHRILLNAGSDIEVIDAPDWRTKDAKLARDIARGKGKTPLLTHQYVRAQAMADAVTAQLPDFGLAYLFESGEPEVVGAWSDPVAGWCRFMADMLLPDLTIWDVKTTDIAITDDGLSRHMSGMGYDFQHAFYERGLECLYPDLKGRVQFNFLFIENREPFAIRPVRLGNAPLAKGRAAVETACRRWAAAKEAQSWPLYGGAVETVEYPPWAVAEWMGEQ